ncbi:hypothetical protein EDD15DRAFT_2328003, partial [Pisolithus albus]
MGIIDARIHENGFVALSGSLALLEVKDWGGARPLTLANPGLESADRRLSRGPFIRVSPSPNGRLLALLNSNGLLWVDSTDFQRSMAEPDTQTASGDT